MKVYNVFSVIALILAIVGALNWMSVGIFGFNAVEWATGSMTWLATVIYILVGVAGIFLICWLSIRKCNMVDIEKKDNNRTTVRHTNKSAKATF